MCLWIGVSETASPKRDLRTGVSEAVSLDPHLWSGVYANGVSKAASLELRFGLCDSKAAFFETLQSGIIGVGCFKRGAASLSLRSGISEAASAIFEAVCIHGSVVLGGAAGRGTGIEPGRATESPSERPL